MYYFCMCKQTNTNLNTIIMKENKHYRLMATDLFRTMCRWLIIRRRAPFVLYVPTQNCVRTKTNTTPLPGKTRLVTRQTSTDIVRFQTTNNRTNSSVWIGFTHRGEKNCRAQLFPVVYSRCCFCSRNHTRNSCWLSLPLSLSRRLLIY